MPITEQELLSIAKQKGVDTSKYEGRIGQAQQPQQPQPQQPQQPRQPQQPQQMNVSMPQRQAMPNMGQGQDTMIGGLLDKINPGFRSSLYGALASGASGKVVDPTADKTGDLQKLYAQEAIKKQFEDPTVRQKREAEINALNQPPPQGFVRNGTQLYQDPNYIKPVGPVDQIKIDEANAKQTEATQKKEGSVQALKDSSQQSIDSIEAAKKGSRFFGPMGDVPSIYSPSSIPLIGKMTEGNMSVGGDYKDRAVWEANVNNLLSKKVVDLIGQMKSLSKTGATGFGNLSDKEGQLLQQASTVLNKKLPPEVALHYLNEMEKIYQKITGGGESQPQQSQQEQGDIRSQYNSLRAQGVPADQAKRQLGL